MSSAVLNGPGLRRTVPSGKVPSRRWQYGAQWRPGRTAIPKLRVEAARRGPAGGRRAGRGRPARGRRRAWPGPSGRRPSSRRRALDPVDDALEQVDLVPAVRLRPALGDPGDARRRGRRRRGRWASPLRGSRASGRAGPRSSSRPRSRLRARREAGRGGRRRGRRCRSGRTATCGRGRPGGRSASPRRSIGTTPGRLRRVDQEQGARPRGRSARSPRSAAPCRGRSRRGSGRRAGSSASGPCGRRRGRGSRRRDASRVSEITPSFSSRRNGRLTELCSRSEVMTWSPGRTVPLIAMFRASVQFRVKTQRSGASPLKNRFRASRASSSVRSASIAIRCPDRPGLASDVRAKRSRVW